MIDVACEAAGRAQRVANVPELRATATKLEGVCAIRRNSEASAVAIFERALPDLDVDEKTEVLLMLAEIDAHRGDDESARLRYERAIENDRQGAEQGGHFSVRAHCELARSHLARRDVRMVLEHLAAAIAVPECCHGAARENIARIAASARDAASRDTPVSAESLEQISGIPRQDWGTRAPGLLAIFESK
jgi:Tfp pilus assembly protein PilF